MKRRARGDAQSRDEKRREREFTTKARSKILVLIGAVFLTGTVSLRGDCNGNGVAE